MKITATGSLKQQEMVSYGVFGTPWCRVPTKCMLRFYVGWLCKKQVSWFHLPLA